MGYFCSYFSGIIAFSLYTITQKHLGASTTGFTLYLFTVYGAFYGIIFWRKIGILPFYWSVIGICRDILGKKRINETK